MRQCNHCKKTKVLSEFYRSDTTYCRDCHKERMLKWSRENREKKRKIDANYKKRIRIKVLEHYSKGNIKCNCCGEKSLEFLCLDHIDNNGSEERKRNGSTTEFYRWLIKNNFPSKLQILCFNCNNARCIYGECPHKINNRQLKT